MYINNPAVQVYSVLEFITTFGTFVIVEINLGTAFGTAFLWQSVDFIVIVHIIAFLKEKIISQSEGEHEFSTFGAVKTLLFFHRQSINGDIADTEHNLRRRLEKVEVIASA